MNAVALVRQWQSTPYALPQYRADVGDNMARALEELCRHAAITEDEIARLRAVIKQIAETPCDCEGPRMLLDGSHLHNCATLTEPVEIAKEEVERWGK